MKDAARSVPSDDWDVLDPEPTELRIVLTDVDGKDIALGLDHRSGNGLRRIRADVRQLEYGGR